MKIIDNLIYYIQLVWIRYQVTTGVYFLTNFESFIFRILPLLAVFFVFGDLSHTHSHTHASSLSLTPLSDVWWTVVFGVILLNVGRTLDGLGYLWQFMSPDFSRLE